MEAFGGTGGLSQDGPARCAVQLLHKAETLIFRSEDLKACTDLSPGFWTRSFRLFAGVGMAQERISAASDLMIRVACSSSPL